MLHIGCHLSTSKGWEHMGKEALSIQADTFQFFTRNPRGAKAKDLDLADVQKLRDLLQEQQFAPLIAHAPYTLNLCGKEEEQRMFAREMMKDDLRRLEFIPGQYYNFHPGSHVGQGIEEGIQLIAEALNDLLKEDISTVILLETMAGKGSEVGSRFEELAAIRSLVNKPEQVGICLDTCHVYDAGYDIVQDLDGVLEEFDRVIGRSHLKAIHLNDSKNPFASHKDRHEKIGLGALGEEAFRRIVTHPVLKDLPFCLETPNELDGYAQEITKLRSFCK